MLCLLLFGVNKTDFGPAPGVIILPFKAVNQPNGVRFIPRRRPLKHQLGGGATLKNYA